MIETKTRTEPLHKEIIPELISAAGPCVTLVVPPYRPGDSAQPAGGLHADLAEAARKLAGRRVGEAAVNRLLDPLREMARDQQGTGAAHVIFRSPEVLHHYELDSASWPGPFCMVGDCFYVRPVFSSLAVPATIYVLEITKQSATLLACTASTATPVNLPKGTPATLEEATGFDPPDHDLKNRSAAGPSVGAMRGAQFGTGSERERRHAHLHDFYRAVDKGVNEVLSASSASLILAGVDEDLAIYRAVNSYPHLAGRAIHGSPGGGLARAEIARRAREIALYEYQQRAAAALADSAERLAPGRFSTDLAVILRAAVQGRVDRLYLDENGRMLGGFDGKAFGGRNNWHDEDLLNIAAVETMRHSGEVFSLPTHLMAGAAVKTGIAAAFRY